MFFLAVSLSSLKQAEHVTAGGGGYECGKYAKMVAAPAQQREQEQAAL
jgi:hypothetical protein